MFIATTQTTRHTDQNYYTRFEREAHIRLKCGGLNLLAYFDLYGMSKMVVLGHVQFSKHFKQSTTEYSYMDPLGRSLSFQLHIFAFAL